MAYLLIVRQFYTPTILLPWFLLYQPQDPLPDVTFAEFSLTDRSRAVIFVVKAIVVVSWVSSLEHSSEATMLLYFL